MSESDHLRIWGGWATEPPPDLDDPRLGQFAREHRLLIIFDSLLRFHEAEENSAKEMAQVMAKLRKLVTAGASVIVLHHSPKSEPRKNSYRGSSEIHAGVDRVYQSFRYKKSDRPTLTLDCFKNRTGREFKIAVRPDFANGQFEVISDTCERETDHDTATLKAVIQTHPWTELGRIIECSGLAEHKVARALKLGDKIHWRIEPGSKKEKKNTFRCNTNPVWPSNMLEKGFSRGTC